MSDRIGALRARVRLLRPGRADDDLGGAAITFTDQGGAWAQIAPQRAFEDASFDAVRGIGAYRITIRARADVRAGWRIAWGARRFRVLAALDAEAHRTQLECEEIAA